MDRNPKETASKIAEEALSRLAAELEVGRSEALWNHLAAMGRFRSYSWKNVLLILAQRPNATQVAGIHSWNDLGRSIKKGEKGIVVFVPGATKRESPYGQDPTDPSRLAGRRATYVYDLSQTEGKPIQDFRQNTGDPTKYAEQIKALFAKRGVDLIYDRSIAPAQSITDGGEIRLMPGLPPAQELSVLTRQLTQEMLRHLKDTAALSQPLRDMQAEAVTYVVSRQLGLEANRAAADSVSRHAIDKKAVAQLLTVVDETSMRILDALQPDQGVFAGPVAAPVDQDFVGLDAAGFSKLHSEYGSRLVQSVTKFVGDRDKAEDIAARAFQAAWANRDRFRGEASPYTWVQAIARNEARQSWARERVAPFDSMDKVDSHEVAAPGLVTDELEKQDDQLRLQKALGQVPVKYRRALTSHFVDGLSIREIASRERIPVGTVLSRIFTGKQLLRNAWEEPLTGPNNDAMAREISTPRRQDRLPPAPPEPGEHQQPSIESVEPAVWDR